MTDFYSPDETRDPAERERALMAALPAQVALARALPAYAERLAGVDARTIGSRAALATLPVTRKHELLEHQKAARAQPGNPDPFGGYSAAGWSADNTALTFNQVAEFTKMHPLEVRAIADGDAAQGIKGMDPISTGQLTREEIEKGEADPEYRLKLGESKVTLPEAKKKKGPRYTPVSRRHERPSAILWLVRNHPELKDSQIMRLVGTTKTTIASVRDRTHWNASTLTPMDPVTLGLCSQIELDFEVQRAAKEKPAGTVYGGATLLPASETTRKEAEHEVTATTEKQRDDMNVDAVFAKLKNIGGKKAEDEYDRFDFKFLLAQRGHTVRHCDSDSRRRPLERPESGYF